MKRFLVPLLLFIVVVGFLFAGLNLDPREVPSPLVGKAAPVFNLPQLESSQQSLAPAELLGQVWLLNVWASWCVACRDEHALLLELAQTDAVPIYGMNYKDQPEDAKQWLAQRGNPYVVTVVDADGRTGIDYGVYGVPETYVIDKAGVIAYKQIGPLSPAILNNKILPLVKQLQSQ
jgi:cytochrome c biogenesis protein CcmG/thiol:disulfide interchange protein DsbE